MSKRPPSPLATPAIIAAARTSASDFALDQKELARAASSFELARLRAGAHRSEARSASGECPPKVTRGERVEAQIIGDGNGGLLEIPARRGWGGDSAFVDWLNFTVKESTFEWGDSQVVSDDQLIAEASFQIHGIFGFGITAQREKGANFYKRSYDLGEFGLVCHGGQQKTVLVSISGAGLAAAKAGWELRLYDFLNNAAQARITRVDLTHDIFDGGTYDVDKAKAEYEFGGFSCGGRTPDCEMRGNWLTPNGKGRTFYVGHRKNGKFARIYEKGKQLGDADSRWVRVEVEFKSVDREIPFDVILKAGEYLAASYPAFEWISETQSRIATTKTQTKLTYNRMAEWAKHQCGAALWTIAQIEGSLEAAFALVSRVGEVPKRLQIPAFDNVTDFLHNQTKEFFTPEAVIDRAFATI